MVQGATTCCRLVFLTLINCKLTSLNMYKIEHYLIPETTKLVYLTFLEPQLSGWLKK